MVLHAELNAREALERRLAETAGQAKLLEATAELFKLAARRSGSRSTTTATSWATNPYGVMIVAGREGLDRSQAYRKFSDSWADYAGR